MRTAPLTPAAYHPPTALCLLLTAFLRDDA